MLRSGMTRHSLAKKCGLSASTISWILSGESCNRGARLRWRVEKAMAAPFWNTPEEFARRMGIIKSIGFDPWLNYSKKLLRECRRAGILDKCPRCAKGIGKEALISMLAAYYQAKGRA